jgi:subtilisin family serine protease
MAAGNRFVIVAHSLGTVIAYQVLAALQQQNRAPEVPLLVTLGSPLGMTEVQDGLKDILEVPNLPQLTTVQRWLNVSDRLDPVAIDSRLQGKYQCAGPLIDVTGFNVNSDGPRDPHSATGYLSHARVRAEVRAVLGTEYSEEVTNFTVARDVADWVEDAAPSSRQEVLIELRTSNEYGVEESRLRLMDQLAALLGSDVEKYCVPLQRFLAVQLTAEQIERLGAFLQGHRYARIWKDSEKSALTDRSVSTVHAPAAWRGYQALGQNIHWAILDTGIRPDHPHFHAEDNIASVWDCTNQGPYPVENPGRGAVGPGIDRHGHGTHVAGVVAGRFPTANPLPEDGEPSGIAPRARLHSYKVLDDNGRGRDSWIIKAVQHIEEVNRRAGVLAIHGVNLSLGGDFDPEVYACGHSPLCSELRRLWRQGVVVVISAGNLGSLTVDAGAGRQVRLNLDLSIGDPANLEDAISVGSVHKTEARLFGISYFSSRGPTADGRYKPDVVAPGERILSARAAFPAIGKPNPNNLGPFYVKMSGTSMAAPHVSGLLAAFLSQRRGYLGRPDELRRVLIDNCTDLGRDRYHQGAGVPNLIRMLLSANS